MKSVVVHSDGGCRGNPGPGGWAFVLTCGVNRKELSGGTPATTNNRMELQAAIKALTSLKEACEVEFFTDSNYLRNGICEWMTGWKRNGWRTTARKPVKNADLWRALDAAATEHRITWRWLKGHAGHEENERCDELANAAMDKIQSELTLEQLRESLRRFVVEAEYEPALELF